MANTDSEYQKTNPAPDGSATGSRVGGYYSTEKKDWKAPPPVEQPGAGGSKEEITSTPDRKATPSIFNRYSLFFVNQQVSGDAMHEEYYDKPNRIGDEELLRVRRDPTASALIQWSREGKTNAVEYAWEDFLWCKNYGKVPNNYMVTMRRFTVPPEDDLFDEKKNPSIEDIYQIYPNFKKCSCSFKIRFKAHFGFTGVSFTI